MRTRSQGAALLALALAASSCSDPAPLGPDAVLLPQPATAAVATPAMPAVRISEFHYDNASGDVGEAVEVSAPADADLTGWQIVLYNGSGGIAYGTPASLTGLAPTTCGERKVVVKSYPANGVQNGAPDGIALLDAAGHVVDFVSYEGELPALAGPAAGITARDVGVSQAGNEAVGGSLQLQPDGSWLEVPTNGFGTCQDGTTTPAEAAVASLSVTPASVALPQGETRTLSAVARDAGGTTLGGVYLVWRSSAPTVASVSPTGVVKGRQPGTAEISVRAPNGTTATVSVQVAAELPPVRFTEIHYDNADVDVGEAIEIEGPAGTDLTDWRIVLYNQTGGAMYDTKPLAGTIADQCDGRGVVAVHYPSNGIQNGGADAFALVDGAGTVVEFLSYEGTLTATDGPAKDLTSKDIGIAEGGSTPTNRSLSRSGIGAWTLAFASFGTCNDSFVPPVADIGFGGRVPSDPPLPVGFQDQIFANLRDVNGTTIPTTMTWSSETPAVATIDEDGVMTALAAGTATFRATAANGITATYSLPTHVATASLTASYVGNAEFGAPTDADPSNDHIVEYEQFTSSFDGARGIPNWVSYNLEATHFGSEDRCDCFTFDPQLPGSFERYTTADYTGAGAFHGYGIDRGHLVRSFDREAGSLDNARSYYFTNIVPQTADNNQGPWGDLEQHLGTFAQSGEHEVYIVAGASGSIGTIKDEGKITIPEHVWKVAVIVPRNARLGDVDDLGDLQVIAAIMPNVPGIRNVDWTTYRTTVDAVEALSGYDVLALLPDALELGAENGGLFVRQLVLDGTISAALGKSLQAKLEAAGTQLARGNVAAALGGYRAALQQLDDLVRDGVLTAQQAAPLRTVLANTVATLGG